MTPAELDSLLALADAATSGPWAVYDDVRPGIDSVSRGDATDRNVIYASKWSGPCGGVGSKADAAFIAAANPDTIRRLVAATREPLDVERLRAVLKTTAQAFHVVQQMTNASAYPLNHRGDFTDCESQMCIDARFALEP